MRHITVYKQKIYAIPWIRLKLNIDLKLNKSKDLMKLLFC